MIIPGRGNFGNRIRCGTNQYLTSLGRLDTTASPSLGNRGPGCCKAPVAECHRHPDTAASPQYDTRWCIEAPGEATAGYSSTNYISPASDVSIRRLRRHSATEALVAATAPVAECHRHPDPAALPPHDNRWRIEAIGEATAGYGSTNQYLASLGRLDTTASPSLGNRGPGCCNSPGC